MISIFKVKRNTFYSTQDGTKLEGDLDRLYAKIEILFENAGDFVRLNKNNDKVSLGMYCLLVLLIREG